MGQSVVAYSLGNFVWYDNSPPNDLTGLLSVELSDAGPVTSFAPARIDTMGRPVPLSGAAADAASATVASLAPGAGRC
jgi:hypothetical protein